MKKLILLVLFMPFVSFGQMPEKAGVGAPDATLLKIGNVYQVAYSTPLQNRPDNIYDSYSPDDNYPRHHTTGYYGVVTGGCMMACGGIIILTDYIMTTHQNNSYNNYNNSSNNSFTLNAGVIVGAAIASAGYYVFIISGIVYLVNKGREHWHHYSVTGTGNQFGLAYNF